MAVDAGGGFKVIAELLLNAGQLPDLIFSQSFSLHSMQLFVLLLPQWEVLSQLSTAVECDSGELMLFMSTAP